MTGKLADRKEGKTMKMRTKLPIVSLVGAGALLLTVLAVIIAPGAQIAYAQSPSVSIRFSSYSSLSPPEGQMEQGEQLFARYTFHNIQNLPCDADLSNIDFGDRGPCFHRGEVYPRDVNIFNKEDRIEQCEGSDFGSDRSFSARQW